MIKMPVKTDKATTKILDKGLPKENKSMAKNQQKKELPIPEDALILGENFYTESLKILAKSKIPFLVGGTYATNAYLGINRPTKDMDIFSKASDYPKILEVFAKEGYQIKHEDERWLAKVYKKQFFFDIIFSSPTTATTVTDDWFKRAQNMKIYNIETKVIGPTEFIFSKAFVQDRHKYEGSDVAHIILKRNKDIDWKILLSYFDQYWEVLLMHILNFRFIYPSEREMIPRWLLDELLDRLIRQANLPTSKVKICRGKVFSLNDYIMDLELGFTDLLGNEQEAERRIK